MKKLNKVSYRAMTNPSQVSLGGFGDGDVVAPKPTSKFLRRAGSGDRCATRGCGREASVNYKGRWLCDCCWKKFCDGGL